MRSSGVNGMMKNKKEVNPWALAQIEVELQRGEKEKKIRGWAAVSLLEKLKKKKWGENGD